MTPTLERPRLFEELLGALANDLVASGRVEDAAANARWRVDPVLWCEEQMRVPRRTLVWSENPGYAGRRWDGTPDPVAALLRGAAAKRRIGVEAGVATQKTFTLALLVLWFLAMFRNSVVVTFAPKKDQLKKHLWREISKLWTRFERLYPEATLDDLRVRMIEGSDLWTAYGFTVGVGADEESAVKAQGAHEKDMLFIVEETPGVHPAIMNALLNTAVDEHNVIVAVGNPDHQLDALHDFCTRTPGALHIRISALDHPNVVLNQPLVPGAVTRASIEEKRARFGSEDAPLFRSRVRGISPAEATDALIRLSWCYAARDRGRLLVQAGKLERLEQLLDEPRALAENLDGPRALGVDVAASADGDRGAIARGRGAVLCEVESFPCEDPNELGARVAVEMRQRGIDPARVCVDAIGVGAGTIGELARQDLAAVGLKGGEAPLEGLPLFGEDERFKNLRAQAWWLLREDLRRGRIALPDDEELFEDLCAVKWTPKDKAVVVESKEDIKKRLRRSPDKGDAAVYWNWVRQVEGETSGGGELVDI